MAYPTASLRHRLPARQTRGDNRGWVGRRWCTAGAQNTSRRGTGVLRSGRQPAPEPRLMSSHISIPSGLPRCLNRRTANGRLSAWLIWHLDRGRLPNFTDFTGKTIFARAAC